MGRLKILEELQSIHRVIFDNETLVINEDTILSEIDKWDERECINIGVAVGRAFEIQMSAEKIRGCNYVSDMISMVEKYISRKVVNVLTLKHTSFAEKNHASSVQKRLYALYCMNPERLDYNITLSIKMEGQLNVKQLQDALGRCLQYNPILTAKFYQINGMLSYEIRSEIQLEIDRAEYKPGNYDSFENLRKSELSSFVKPFQLSSDELLIRARLINYGYEKYLLLLDIHHIIFDGVSVSVFLEDLQQFYNDPYCDREKKYNYRDFVDWQGKFVESDEYEKSKNIGKRY